MKKKLIYVQVTLFAIAFTLSSSCTSEWRRKKDTNTWSSSNPAEIPYDIRIEEFNKKNLVKNYSFEDGTLAKSEDSTLMQKIQNWEIIGENVVYCIDSLSDKKDNKIVKIQRKKAHETDIIGDGVMSDFIEVIPGNYDFNVKVKLEKIKPQFERVGTRLFDAINIRLFFYDSDKKQVSPEIFYPYTDTYLDNSFKGYSFSNFFYIDELDWSTINARTYNYPFTEGDIPDGTKYVKIFIGLKGIGTMWVDDINFSYSKWNFTTAERMAWYKDETFSPVEMLIPTPKHAHQENEIKLKANEGVPVIVNNFKASELSKHTEKYLKEEIENILRDESDVKIVPNSDNKEVKDASVVFLLTSYDKIKINRFKDIEANIIEKPQSYIIFDSIINNKTHIIIAAKDNYGLFYGATTIVRLLNKENKSYQHANIVDYPDFVGRGYQLRAWKNEQDIEKDIEYINYLTFYRFNKAYLPYYQNDDAKKWFAPTDILLKGTKAISSYIAKNKTIQIGVMFNPYYHFEYEMHTSKMSDSIKYIFQHNEKGIEMIKKTLKPVFDQGATFLMLLADDFVPHSSDYRKIYSLWTPEDIKRHTNIQNAQAYLVTSLHQWLKHYGDIRFELCPPWYLNEFIDKSRGHAEAYFRDMHTMIPEDVVMIWTGNTVRTLSFDSADLKRYADLAGHQPMLWDNTLYARALGGIYGGYPAHYPERTYLCNLFEPYDVKTTENYYLSSPHMYTNGNPTSEIYKIKYATVADFQWNMSAYNPELSLWKTLVNHFGKEIAWKMIELNETYFDLLGSCIIIEKSETQSENEIDKINKLTEQLNDRLYMLSEDLNAINSNLYFELEDLCKKIADRVDAINKNNAKIEKDGKEQI